MSITRIDRTQIATIREHALSALRIVADQWGLDVRAEGGNFTDANCVLKFQFAVRNEDGGAVTREVEAFRKHCRMFQLAPDDFGRPFRMSGRTFKIVGLNTKARTACLVLERDDRKRFKASPEQVRAAFALEAQR